MSDCKKVLTGTSGWHRLEGFYPPRTRPSDMLGYYAEHFSVVEIATTFQGIPREERVKEWANSVPSGFVFDVLAFGGLTLHQTRPGVPTNNASHTWLELAVEPPDVLFDEFASAISPLIAADKLGIVLLQFPPWFDFGREGFDYLERCRNLLSGIPLGVELRNPSWFFPGPRLEETLDRLIDLEIALSVADFPQERAVPPFLPNVTMSDVVPVRLHGRLEDSWPKIGGTAITIAQFTYGEEELSELIRPVTALAAEADQVHAIFNVQPSAEAIRAATEFQLMMDTQLSKDAQANL